MESYEKKYKDALKRAKKLYEQGTIIETLSYVFPELKESEDEKIRKEIIRYLKRRLEISSSIPAAIGSWIAWLEKQGDQKTIDSLTPQEAMDIAVAKCFNEQKSADKIEPKFKVGEWITHNTANFVFKIINVGSNGYEVVNRENYKKTISFDNEDNYHLWTIQDAKDGDVLLFEGYYNSIVLFQGIGINGKGRINYHCKCDLGNYSFGVQGDVACLGTIEKDSEHYHPATKEHRELLFKKMHEAGYTFDFDKKELKKIEQKPAWSEEDNMKIEETLYFLREYQQSNRCKDENGMQNSVSCEKWLKSLKERIGV